MVALAVFSLFLAAVFLCMSMLMGLAEGWPLAIAGLLCLVPMRLVHTPGRKLIYGGVCMLVPVAALWDILFPDPLIAWRPPPMLVLAIAGMMCLPLMRLPLYWICTASTNGQPEPGGDSQEPTPRP